MGYYANWEGSFEFKEKPQEEQIKILKREFCSIYVYEPKYSPDKKWSVGVCGSGDYSEADIYDALEKLTPFITAGEIKFSGDDDIHWKIELNDGNWNESSGNLIYSKDEALSKYPPVDDDERCEFIGQIIDIFEDFLEEKGIEIPNPERPADDEENGAIIYGSDYGILQDDLEQMMRAWKILKEDGK